jgi:hypothetical protein
MDRSLDVSVNHIYAHMLLVQFDASGTKSELQSSKCANTHQIGHTNISPSKLSDEPWHFGSFAGTQEMLACGAT